MISLSSVINPMSTKSFYDWECSSIVRSAIIYAIHKLTEPKSKAEEEVAASLSCLNFSTESEKNLKRIAVRSAFSKHSLVVDFSTTSGRIVFSSRGSNLANTTPFTAQLLYR